MLQFVECFSGSGVRVSGSKTQGSDRRMPRQIGINNGQTAKAVHAVVCGDGGVNTHDGFDQDSTKLAKLFDASPTAAISLLVVHITSVFRVANLPFIARVCVYM